jgi:hypothetical protein
LYADILSWLKKGWIDYVIPQLYWEHGHRLADYDELVNWWNQHNYNRNLYIGHGIYRAGSSAAWKSSLELPYQINKLRSLNNTRGSAYFSSANFKNNPNHWNDSLQNHYYKKPALQPTMPWLVQYEVETPVVNKKSVQNYQIEVGDSKKVKQFAILSLTNKEYAVEAIIPGSSKIINLNSLGIDKKSKTQYWIVAIGLQNQLSKLVAL